MAHQTASGASLGISLTAPATHDQAGWDALSLTPVGEITNVGDFGKEWALVTHNPLNTRGTKKGKGSFNNGTLSPTLALDPGDAGQIAMETSLESDDNAYFVLTLQDGTRYVFVCLVMAFRVSVGGVDDVVNANTTLEVQPDQILKFAA